MNMEFLILQGNTQKINQIDYQRACYQRERVSVQEDITRVSELMQNYEDGYSSIINNEKANAKNEYDMSISQFQTETSNASKAQNAAKATLDSATAEYSTANTQLQNANKGVTDAEARLKQLKDDQASGKEILATAIADAEKAVEDAKAKQREAEQNFNTAESLKNQAQQDYTNKANLYSATQEVSTQNQKIAYQNYQDKLNEIEAMNKTFKSTAEATQKANLAALNKRDTQLELSINELDSLKTMLKEEKSSAKEAVESEAKELAPKYS